MKIGFARGLGLGLAHRMALVLTSIGPDEASSVQVSVDLTHRPRSTGPASILIFPNTLLRFGACEAVGDRAWVGPRHVVDVGAMLWGPA